MFMVLESKEEHASNKKERSCILKKIYMALNNAFKPAQTEEVHTVVTGRDEMYESFNVDKYKIVCTLDKHTCSICGDLDGQVFNAKDRKVGVNAPPFHQDCRCVDVPHCPNMKDGERIARDAQGNNYYVSATMNYNQWKKSLITDEKESS